jgi:hypothetical protein
VERDCADEV